MVIKIFLVIQKKNRRVDKKNNEFYVFELKTYF